MIDDTIVASASEERFNRIKNYDTWPRHAIDECLWIGGVRPQVLKREQNPRYYAMIAAFEHLTGIGAVLNTSLNIHGYPIVRTAQEALDVFTKNDIDGMLVDDVLVLKKR